MIPLLLLLFYGAATAGTGATIKWMASDDDIPSEPSRHDVVEKVTVLKHYPGGTVEGSDTSSGYDEYRRLSALNEQELKRRVLSIRRQEGWNESKIGQIVSEHLTIERHLQRDYAEAISKSVSDWELNNNYSWALVALRHGKRFCE
jgi:hypothetical protein